MRYMCLVLSRFNVVMILVGVCGVHVSALARNFIRGKLSQRTATVRCPCKGTISFHAHVFHAINFGVQVPLCHRIPHLHEDIPITFIYGRHDWMDAGAAKLVKTEAIANKKQCNVHIVNECGHQLYIENPDGFNQVVAKYCQPRTTVNPKL